MLDQNTTSSYDLVLRSADNTPTVSPGYDPITGQPNKPVMVTMETASEPGTFETLIDSTGSAIGNVLGSLVNAGSTALNTSINNLAPKPVATVPTVKTDTSGTTYLILAALVLGAAYLYKRGAK